MNLCGGIVSSADAEFLIPSVLPSESLDDEVTLTLASATKNLLTPRRRKKDGRVSPETYMMKTASPSARSSKNKRMPSASEASPSPLLNPLSKEDLKKSRNRQRPSFSPLNTIKSHSANMKKLESGFRLIWHTSGELEAPNVTMELSPDRSLLRLYEIDPDGDNVIDSLGTDAKALDLKIRVQDISRLEIGKPKPSSLLSEGDESPPSLENVPSTKYFSITLSSKTEKETSIYGFQTESVSDRDTIISGLKLLLDQTKASSMLKRPKGIHHGEPLSLDQNTADGPNGTLSPMQRTHIHNQSSTNSRREKSGDSSRKSERPIDEGTETSLACFDFDFDMAKRDIGWATDALQKDITMLTLNDMTEPATLPTTSRKYPIGPASTLEVRPEGVGQDSSDDDTRDNSAAGENGDDLRDRNTGSSDGESNKTPISSSGSSSLKGPESAEVDEVRELSVRILESDSLREESVEVTGSEWSESGEWPPSGTGKSRARDLEPTRTKVNTGKSGVAIIAHRPGDLKHVEDIELMDIANKMGDPWCADDICTSALAGQMAEQPWCTDDICSAALKDVAETCKGIFDIKQQAEAVKKTENMEGHREIVEDYIAGVLGAPSAMATMLSVGDVWNAPPTAPAESEPTVNRIQNRASVRNAQALRLQQLRNEMTFEAVGRLSREKLHFVQTVTSNDDIEASKRREKQKTAVRESPEPGLVDQFDSSALLQQVVGNIVAPEPLKKEEEILYYDSDPESYRLRTHFRGPRRVQAERSNEIEEGPRRRRRTLSGIPVNRLMAGRRWKKMDDNLVSDIIEAMKNEKLTLMWHPTQTKQCPNRTPQCVKVWIESGVYLVDGTFLLPKLTWVPLHERNLPSKRLNISKDSPERLDLLDVCRVRESEAVDRRLHPFARADRSFVIQTQSEVFLFEAQSQEERSRIVNGLKLVIARLASLLMLRDLRAVDEFFGSGSVPGEAPAWTSGHDNSADSDDKNT